MNVWDSVDELMQIEKMQNLIKSTERQLQVRKLILQKRQLDLVTGGYKDLKLTPETAQLEISELEQGIATCEQKIAAYRRVLDQGPKAVRSALEQLSKRGAEELDAWRAALKRMEQEQAQPPQQFVRRPGGGVGSDVPTGDPPGAAGGDAAAGAAAPEPPLPTEPAPQIGRVPVGVGSDVPLGGPGAAGGDAAAGAAAPEPLLPTEPAPQIARMGAAAAEEAAAGGEMAAGAGAEAGISLGRLLGVALLAAAVLAGAYLAYNHFTSPSSSSSQASTFNINGDYNGTVNGAQCAKPECYVTIQKVSDPSGPAPSQAGKITVVFTAKYWEPAFNGVASVINAEIGYMDASLDQDGTVHGSGRTSLWDPTTLRNTVTPLDYTLNGKISGGTSGSPSYTLTLDANPVLYHMTGTRATG
jgi:hypothetical protein